MSLTIKKLIRQCASRSRRWHGPTDGWTILEWAGAMAGECGEACNAAKKLRRIEQGLPNINTGKGRSLTKINKAKKHIAQELADTIIYSMAMAIKIDVDLEQAIIDVFNQKSEEYGFPERL